MPERMGIRDLRDNLTTTMRRVRAGETIEITHHGEPVAVLAPVGRDRLARLVASGGVTPPVGRMPRSRPLPITGEMTASEAIEEDRAER